jgi:hypothetical protein
MANRFLNNIKINDSYTLPAADGTADQVITTDGSGQLSFVDQSAINAGNAEHVVIYAKNTSGASISKGTPVYITGTVGATDTVQIAPADASNSAKMPAVGLLDDTLANNAFGYVITGGFMDNITTDPIDGSTPSSNDTVYVKSGGGLTLTKPTGASNLIQNVAKVGKVSGGNAGSLIVSSILRTNDVPNLNTGKIWVGDGNTTESTVVHLDETNNEMGINTNNPAAVLHVTRSSGTVPLFQVDDIGDKYFQVLPDSNTTFLIGDLDALGGNGYIKGTFDSIQFHSDSGELVRIKDNGNVGIGTTDPQKNLVVSDTSDAVIRINNTKNGTWTVGEELGRLEWYGNDASGEGAGVKGYIKLDSDNIYGAGFDMRFGTTDGTNGITERMVITKSGNVGIGTTNPAAGYLLDVNGLGAFNTAVSVQGIDTGNPTAANEEIRLSGFGVMGSRTSFYVTNANASGSIYFGVGGAHNANNKALINSSGISAPRYSDIDNSAFYLEPGSGATGQWKVQTPSGYVSIGPNNTGWAHFYTDRSNGYYFDKRIVVDTGIFASYNENLTLQAPYNTTRMTISSSNGNVGINNTSPSAELHVGGSTDQTTVLKIEAGDNTAFPATTSELRMIGYGSRGQGVFFEDTSNSGEEWFAGLNYSGGWDKYSIGYDASGGQAEYTANAIFTVKGSVARVGIGTTDPASKLEVDGGDIEIDDSDRGLILRAPNGTRYRLQVANDGSLSTTAL